MCSVSQFLGWYQQEKRYLLIPKGLTTDHSTDTITIQLGKPKKFFRVTDRNMTLGSCTGTEKTHREVSHWKPVPARW